ncbi:lysophospholipid acyltransferase family protein [Maritimibacter dapengensis]|uniref:1-acyl-sn-glycerol-3-phosphate acyltransferase n=1 Tax=Maritimibacter dapengensis TaxID=2836868 RepID=A0ABS6SWS5_9RHOB|nr:lysophospholipid acyltransferase family protein [Maritimibacter dapengensis]MBV7377408.1 1-acyl-sn-glycerol-3-phosphate acyltransferase [Maritimibacter dapengensis]
MQAIQLIRSLVFIFLMYAAMGLMGVVYFFLTLFNRDMAYTAVGHYTMVVRFLARWVIGLRSEIRGEVPTDEVLICSKHQSFFDIILIVSAVPRPKFIMKKQLVYAPVLGYFAKAIGCIPVDRGKRGAAVKKMIEDVASGAARPGQLIIFPQGTRVAAGAKKPYKIGSGVLYTESGQRCIPAATNVGVFWPRHGLMRKPGLAVLEFLPAVEPGLPINDFMEHIEEAVEENSNRLMREAGFDPDSYEGD